MKKLLSLFIMGFAVLCNASSNPPPLKAVQATFSRPYDNINQAAIAAVQASYHLSNHVEYGGMLVYNTKTGKYEYQTPHTDHFIDHVRLNHFITFIGHPELKIVADYHTHPCFPYTHVPTHFSSQDVFIYMMNDTPGYMGNFCTGQVQVWDPHNLKYLIGLTGPGPFGIDYHKTYVGTVVGAIILNRYPDIQETMLDALPIFRKF